MKMAECAALIDGKKCPKCHHVLQANNVGWTGDKFGWKVDDSGFPMTAIIYCPNRECGRQFCMEDFGIRQKRQSPLYIM
jgi:hypothetical protein